jgi:large repetitive protein
MVYFNAADASDVELWKSDGTTAGTVKVKDILPGEIGSQPQLLTMSGSTLFSVANDGVHGSELWKSDGTWKTSNIFIKTHLN